MDDFSQRAGGTDSAEDSRGPSSRSYASDDVSRCTCAASPHALRAESLAELCDTVLRDATPVSSSIPSVCDTVCCTPYCATVSYPSDGAADTAHALAWRLAMVAGVDAWAERAALCASVAYLRGRVLAPRRR